MTVDGKNNLEKKLNEVVKKVVENFQPEKIILFGSYAWGKPTRESDFDLLVIKESKQTPLEMMREINRIIFKREVAIDVLAYTKEQVEKRQALGDPFLKRILTLGRVLYAK